jgi:chromosome segregation ATPase
LSVLQHPAGTLEGRTHSRRGVGCGCRLLEHVQQLEAAAAEGAAAARRAAQMSAAAEAAAERERALQAQVEGAAARSLDKGALTAVLQAEQGRLKDALAAATMSGATLNDALRTARAELDTAHAQLAACKARCDSRCSCFPCAS